MLSENFLEMKEAIPIKLKPLQDVLPKKDFSTAKTENVKISSKNYTKDSTYCNSCNFKASSNLSLKVHIEMKHLQLRFICIFCQYSTKEKYTVTKHVRKEHPEKNFLDCEYRCGSCQLQEPLKVFKEHFPLFHPELKVLYNERNASYRKHNTDNKKGERICKFCSFKAKTTLLLNTHMKDSHIDILYQCNICDKEFRSKEYARFHIIQRHISRMNKMKMKISINNLSEDQRKYVWDNLLRRCMICQKNIVKDENIENHILVNHPDKHEKPEKGRKRKSLNWKFKCQECNFSGKLKWSILKHMKSMHLDIKYFCKECSFETTNIETHIANSHNQKDLNRKTLFQFKCTSCAFITENHFEFDQHVKEKHLPYLSFEKKNKISPNLPYKCKECKYASGMISSLKRHIMAMHMKAKFTCSNCKSDFSQYQKYRSHISNSHNGDMSVFECYCSSCEIQLKSHDFNNHLKVKHFYIGNRERSLSNVKSLKHDDNPTYFCKGCDVKTENKNQIIEHIYENHEVEEDLDENQLLDIIELICKSCSFNGSFSEFYEHLNKDNSSIRKQEKDNLNIRCNICYSDCNNSRELVTHKIKTHGQCQYVCRKCDFKHSKWSAVASHSKEEHNCSLQPYNMYYLCGFCSYRGTLKKMEDHLMSSHTEEIQKKLENLQMFNCTSCDYQNINISKLTTHTKSTHFRFDCGYCEESFSQFHKVSLHRIKFHETTMFDCQLCSFTSKHQISFYRHRKQFHSKCRFLCNNCGRKFNRKDYLKNHKENCNNTKSILYSIEYKS